MERTTTVRVEDFLYFIGSEFTLQSLQIHAIQNLMDN